MNKTLSIGDTGEEVRRWQEYLISQGFRVNADSKFGASTLAATRAMQRRLGVKADGKVGHRTLDRQSTTQATPLPQARPDMPPAPAPPTMADMLTGDKTGGDAFTSSGPEADLAAMHSAASNRAWDQQVSSDSVGHDTDMRAEQAAMLMNPAPPVTRQFTDQGAPPTHVLDPAIMAAQGINPNFAAAGPTGGAGASVDMSTPTGRDQLIRALMMQAGGGV